jgi:hypothetical protein
MLHTGIPPSAPSFHFPMHSKTRQRSVKQDLGMGYNLRKIEVAGTDDIEYHNG